MGKVGGDGEDIILLTWTKWRSILAWIGVERDVEESEWWRWMMWRKSKAEI